MVPNLLILFVIAIFTLGFILMLAVYQDLSRRLERLKALAASVQNAKQLRQGVGQIVNRQVTQATRHERGIASEGARRGRGGGNSAASVRDNHNGWPSAQHAIGALSEGLKTTVTAANLESQAREQLIREAEQYNAAIRSYPGCLFADLLGFRVWQFTSGRKRFRRS
jgi:hypothetical protein